MTIHGRPVATLTPVESRSVWVPKRRAIELLVQADAPLATELYHVLGATIDER